MGSVCSASLQGHGLTYFLFLRNHMAMVVERALWELPWEKVWQVQLCHDTLSKFLYILTVLFNISRSKGNQIDS